MKRNGKTITIIDNVTEILKELKDYWPLTLRQIYYQLVSRLVIENHKNQYVRLSSILARAREDGLIPWGVMEDRTRILHDLSGWPDADSFIDQEKETILKGYRRDLLQTQDNYIELWVEKDALSRIFTGVAARYTMPVVVSRGFSSVSFLNKYRERVENHPDMMPLILYFSDLDPSGLAIPEAVRDGLLKLEVDVEVKRCALLPDDIERYDLPHDPEALKPNDTRAKRYIEQYGHYAVELDALHPDTLIKRIIESIEDNIDLSAYETESEQQDHDRSNILLLRDHILDEMSGIE